MVSSPFWKENTLLTWKKKACDQTHFIFAAYESHNFELILRPPRSTRGSWRHCDGPVIRLRFRCCLSCDSFECAGINGPDFFAERIMALNHLVLSMMRNITGSALIRVAHASQKIRT